MTDLTKFLCEIQRIDPRNSARDFHQIITYGYKKSPSEIRRA